MNPREIKIGMAVTYWGMITKDGKKFDPFSTVITSEPWQLGSGEWVCRVSGKSGGVAISHLVPLP